MKIRVIGPSGSGKTVFSKKLSEKLSIPHYDLDDLFWVSRKNLFEKKQDPGVRDAMLRDILEKEDWIIDGPQHTWPAGCFSDADLILFLNPSPFLCRFRILKRFMKRRLFGAKKESLRTLITLLKWTKKYYRKLDPEIRSILASYPEKTIEIKTNRELKEILNTDPAHLLPSAASF